MRKLARAALLLAMALAGATTAPSLARADEAAPVSQAAKHFQRGVQLYGEADYRAALVEFKRAQAIAPNATVLYNIGETQFQLQDYAGAMVTFERFLVDAPGDPRRAEVEGNLEVLRTRVGHVTVVTEPAGADVSVDDQPMGRTPFERSLLVSIGRRKVVASLAGRPTATRYVEVAADDNVSLTLEIPEAGPPAQPGQAAKAVELPPQPPDASSQSHSGTTLRVLGWVATGLLAGGAVAFGVLALKESSTLESARGSYPVSSETLNHDASLTTAYSITADALAAGALVAGGITLTTTLLHSSSSPPRQGGAGTTQVVLGPSAVRLHVTF
jgi:tetratricopeptide (TPR) repeat protein